MMMYLLPLLAKYPDNWNFKRVEEFCCAGGWIHGGDGRKADDRECGRVWEWCRNRSTHDSSFIFLSLHAVMSSIRTHYLSPHSLPLLLPLPFTDCRPVQRMQHGFVHAHWGQGQAD